MAVTCILREALRSITYAALTTVIFLQALAGAVTGGAIAAHKALGLDQLSVICSSDGAKRTDDIGFPQQHHVGKSDCCAWAFAGKPADHPFPLFTTVHARKPGITVLTGTTPPIADAPTPHPGPPRQQEARAPPDLQT